MKLLISIASLLLFTNSILFAQDVIHKLDGTTIEAKVKEIGESEIKYNRTDNISGPLYTINKKEVFKVVYENGHVDVFEHIKRTEIETKEERAKRLAEEEANRKKEEKKRKESEKKKHTIYAEILGLSGLFSANYQPRIFTSENGIISLSARVGLGMSNKAVHIPHGLVLGIGSQRHQFEVGLIGVIIAKLAENDLFNFLYGAGKESRYSFSPMLGYRLYSRGGFTFNVNVLMIYSKDRYQLGGIGTYEAQAGITPWFGIGLGYGF